MRSAGWRTTGEVAAIAGCEVDNLKKWKRRGHLKLAPKGERGQGRGHELLWSPEAVAEAVERARDCPDVRYVRTAQGQQDARELKQRLRRQADEQFREALANRLGNQSVGGK